MIASLGAFALGMLKVTMLADVTLSMLLAHCAPNVDRSTMTSVIFVESSAWPWTIGDNTTRSSYTERSYGDAVEHATRLLNEGHNLDLGLAQLNSANMPGLGLTVEQALEPCTNTAAGAHILSEDYATASRVYGAGQTALFHAFMAYNTGSIYDGEGYARKVVAMAEDLGFFNQSASTEQRLDGVTSTRIASTPRPAPTNAALAELTRAHTGGTIQTNAFRGQHVVKATPAPVFYP